MIYDVNGKQILPGDTVAFFSGKNRYENYWRGIKTGIVRQIIESSNIVYTSVRVYVEVKTPKPSYDQTIIRNTDNLLRLKQGALHEDIEEDYEE